MITILTGKAAILIFSQICNPLISGMRTSTKAKPTMLAWRCLAGTGRNLMPAAGEVCGPRTMVWRTWLLLLDQLNQLQQNILWSQKSNFLEIPTDCPMRERAGWTGDAQIFVAAGSFLMQTAGFFTSTPYLCPVLGNNGHLDLVYALLMQDTPPSWLYAVKKGATTIGESWDGIDEEGTPHHSLNHYAYGAIGNWLYQAVAGIAPGAPGYRQIMFQPQPAGGLTFASATYQSLYGTIATSWQIDGERFQLTVTAPTNTNATVVIPTRLGRQITEGGVALESAVGIRGVRREQKATFIEIGSGMYRFTAISTS